MIKRCPPAWLMLLLMGMLVTACSKPSVPQFETTAEIPTKTPIATVTETPAAIQTESPAAVQGAAWETAVLHGVNLAGAEFGDCTNHEQAIGIYNEIIAGSNYYLDKGMNVIRLPFCWERLQNQLFEPLNPDELANIHSVVAHVTEQNAYLLLDPHNYARYDEQVIGAADSGVSQAAFANFWTRLAAEFANNDHVIFGLMNEPNEMSSELWVADANVAIAAIRKANANNLILVPGNGWTGAHSWEDDYYGTPNAIALLDIVDPIDNYAIELHQYLDDDSSGYAENVCVSKTIGAERLTAVTAWLHEQNLRAFLGEFGGRTDDVCLGGLDGMLDYMAANADVWLGWSYWAGGPWWGDYPYTLEPIAGEDQPQMDVLEAYLVDEPTAVPQLLQNPGLEPAYDTIATGCTTIGGSVASQWLDNSCWEGNENANVAYAKENDNPHGGSAAQRIEVQNGIVQFGQEVLLQAGKLYTATVWMRAQSPMDVTFILRKRDYPYTYFSQRTVTLSTAWAQVSINGFTNDTDGYFMITSEDVGTFWVDDASLTAVSSPPAPLPTAAIPKQYFGMHMHSAELPWPPEQLNIGAIRLWDAAGSDANPLADAQWATINTAPGVYDWTTLDMHVNRALANGAEIVFNLGRTPQWASARPDEPTPYGPGQAAEPADDQYWQDWVTAVGTRYQGKITTWEIWNEPNYEWFWTGSTEKLVSLSQQAHDILKTIDPNNQIVSPSPFDPGFLHDYLALGGGETADIIGYHFYLEEGETPEFLYESYVPIIKQIMAANGQGNKPLWDSENGWPAQPLADDLAVGYLTRAYLLEWAAGVERLYFYSWDGGEPVVLADPFAYDQLNAVGIAYAELSDWLLGARMVDIEKDANETWTIQLAQADGTMAYVLWNPAQTLNFDLPTAWQIDKMRDLEGNVTHMDGATQVTISPHPVLLQENGRSTYLPLIKNRHKALIWHNVQTIV